MGFLWQQILLSRLLECARRIPALQLAPKRRSVTAFCSQRHGLCRFQKRFASPDFGVSFGSTKRRASVRRFGSPESCSIPAEARHGVGLTHAKKIAPMSIKNAKGSRGP